MPAGTTVARRDLERLWIPTWSWAVDVRTTIRNDDDLYREVKAMAARQGRTVRPVVEDALRAATFRLDDDTETPMLSTADGTGLLPGVDLTDSAALLEVMDADGRR